MKVGSIINQTYITSSGRDLRLDFLRGYFVIIMIVDHMAGRSPLHWFTGGGDLFFVSGAEGFFVISGLVAGIVYHRIIDTQGFEAAFIKILHRILVLYIVGVTINLLNLPFSYNFWVVNQPPEYIQPDAILRIFFLKTGNIIITYALLFIAVPFAFLLLKKGRGGYLLLGSWTIYLVYVLYPKPAAFPLYSAINLMGIQVLFFTALFIGYKKHLTLDYGSIYLNKKCLLAFSSAFFLLIVLYFFLHPLPWMQRDLISDATVNWINLNLFDKVTLRPGRVLSALVVFGTFFIVLSLYWEKISNIIGWLVMPFGTSALYAYTLHIPIGSVINNLIDEGIIKSSHFSNMLIQIVAVFFIWFFTKNKVLAPTKNNIRYWYGFPFIFALLLLLVDSTIHSNSASPYILRALVYWINWFPWIPAGI